MENEPKKDLLEWALIIIAFIFLAYLFKLIEINKPLLLTQVLSGVGGAIGIYLLYLRFKTTDDIKKQSAKHFAIDNEFKSFIESTKLLTDKESSVEAKISALYLLYDLSKIYPNKTARILQVINKQLEPLFVCIENRCNEKIKTKKLTKYKLKGREKSLLYEYNYKDLLQLNIDSNSLIQTIKEWRYKGNDTEKLISVSLDIIKKMAITTIQKKKKHIDISNSIIFDIDVLYNRGLKFKNEKYPTENLIFLNCVLTDNNDFSKTIYHNCKFINCDLTNANFQNSNLWGSSFINCNLKNTCFEKTECEAVEFKKCINLNKQQIEKMRFNNKTKKTLEYLLILSEDMEEKLELTNKSYFKTFQEYNNWKNNL